LYTVGKLLSSLCDPGNCSEKRKIIFDAGNPYVLHFRIDGVFITDQTIKKNDCLVIYNQPNAQQISFLFLVEVKDSSYTLDAVVSKLQNSKDILNNNVFTELGEINNLSEVLRLLPTAYRKKATARLVLQSLERIRKNKYRLIPVLCAKTNKARRKRNLTPRFGIKIGDNFVPILYLKHKTDAITEIRRIISIYY
jgi:hypothetical protein